MWLCPGLDSLGPGWCRKAVSLGIGVLGGQEAAFPALFLLAGSPFLVPAEAGDAGWLWQGYVTKR